MSCREDQGQADDGFASPHLLREDASRDAVVVAGFLENHANGFVVVPGVSLLVEDGYKPGVDGPHKVGLLLKHDGRGFPLICIECRGQAWHFALQKLVLGILDFRIRDSLWPGLGRLDVVEESEQGLAVHSIRLLQGSNASWVWDAERIFHGKDAHP